jgi:GT2 family glycosyltransferase
VRVSAVIVSHEGAADLEESLPALRPQVDELLVIANIPGSAPAGIEALENEHPLGYAANLNRGLGRRAAHGLSRRAAAAVAAALSDGDGHSRSSHAAP